MISVIILAHNQHQMTEQCIESVFNHTVDFELIVIDNGSDPVFLSGNEYIKVIANTENLGFPAAVNQGIRAATGDIICLLNNDTIVTPGWLDKMVSRLDDYAIVSSMTNYAAGIQRTLVDVYEDETGLNIAANKLAEQHKDKTFDVNFVIGFCMVFKKTLFDEIGEFDESMWPCSGEEIDFCFRSRKAGYKIGIAQDVYIHHYGSQTFGEMQNAGILSYEDVCKKCDAHLSEKWGADFWTRQIANIPKSDMVRLNLGCGRYPMSGWTNVDQFENVNPDLVSDALDLPYEPGSVDEIYCGHMLEHLTFEDGQKALKYWHRLLAPGGKISVTVPDFDVLVQTYLEIPTAGKLKELNDIFIYSYCQESHHRYCYSGNLLKDAMQSAGFINLKRLPVDHEYFVDPVDWQVAYSGRKA